jgi:adenylyl-sulfate kinase
LALALEQRLIVNRRSCYILDGDKVRQGLNSDLGFSSEDRSENIRRVAEVAKLMNDAGLIVIAAFISPYQSDREMACEIIGKERFVEVHLSTPIEACEKRDVKGLYKKARAGALKEFTGVSAPYEIPLQPYIRIDTSMTSIEDSMMQLYKIIIKGASADK